MRRLWQRLTILWTVAVLKVQYYDGLAEWPKEIPLWNNWTWNRVPKINHPFLKGWGILRVQVAVASCKLKSASCEFSSTHNLQVDQFVSPLFEFWSLRNVEQHMDFERQMISIIYRWLGLFVPLLNSNYAMLSFINKYMSIVLALQKLLVAA